MKQFNVLDRSQRIHQHYLLEASAGTGKTFSIQNIVVRLLVESKSDEEPFTIQKILVVTFTRAATRDLKVRIRSTIEQAVNILQHWMHEGELSEQIPDYLRSIIEQGGEAVRQARRRLQQALFSFDQAQILTIHGFCARMLRQFALESDMGFHALAEEEQLPQTEVMGVIRDFFRTEIRLEHYCPAQLEIVLKGDPKQSKLFNLIQKGHEFAPFPVLDEIYIQFVERMRSLKQAYPLTSEKMIEDFKAQSGAYRNYKSGISKADVLDKVIRFAQLFDRDEWTVNDLDHLIRDGVVWVMALDPALHKGRTAAVHLHYPELTDHLRKSLHPLIQEAGSFPVLLSRMARDCQGLLHRYQKEEEKLSPDDILRKMVDALDQSDFKKQVQANFQAAIIDEFQDTDPIQWNIFQRLFLSDPFSWKGYLYLVGDPKQSIYSFRQADIYTYLAAANALGESHCYSLDVNYRSQPRLVDALNQLFAADYLPHFIPLPKQGLHLPYQPVRAAPRDKDSMFEDERGSIHFFMADGEAFPNGKLNDFETHVFFPFIAREILRLKLQKGFSYRQFAVLVRDRHQAMRLVDFLTEKKIPFINQRGASLADSPALQAFTELIRAILQPYNRGALRAALGNPLLGWTHAHFKESESIEAAMLFVQRLRSCLFEKGFAAFFQELLHSRSLIQETTLLNQIISREGGLEFYRDLQQIADIVIDYHYREWNSPEGIIPFLDQFQLWSLNDDERLKRYQDPGVDGVNILTLHFSKGLEFDVVFALGLVKRSKSKEDLFPVESEGRTVLQPLEDDSEECMRHYEELDAEKMRQLYVALTRAKYQLYIPIVKQHPSEKLSYGEASPLDLFLARLRQPVVGYETLYERIRQSTDQHLIDFIDQVGKDHDMTYSLDREVVCDCAPVVSATAELPMEKPLDIQLLFKPLWITSFTTLSQQMEHVAVEKKLLEHPPSDYKAASKDVHTLPANSETGLIVHSLMENLNFADFRNLKNSSQALEFVQPWVQNSRYGEWENPLANLVFNTLKTPLPQINAHFCLADVDPGSQYREMPFLFPFKKPQQIEELNYEEGLIKGVIDYFFVHNGIYYLVDWKTNWLGPHCENYEISCIKAAMRENVYELQAAIYTEALKRYLKVVDPRPFKQCFGGVFYLFLRGMHPSRTTGIYHFFPEIFNAST